MIKALFFDLDGTLLNSEKTISHETATALKKCKEKGLKLFIATARPPLLDKMLPWNKKIFSIFDGGSYYNGGCIKIGGEAEYISICDEIVLKIINCVYEYDNTNIALQLEGEKHAFRFPLTETGYKSWGVTEEESLALNQIQNLKTIKILVFFDNLIDSVTPIDKNLVEKLKNLCIDTAKFYLTDRDRCIQVMAKSVNKIEQYRKNQIKI